MNTTGTARTIRHWGAHVGPVLVSFGGISLWALRWRYPRPTVFISIGRLRITIDKPRFTWNRG